MAKYRKKPVVIEAQGPISEGNANEIAEWCGATPAMTGMFMVPTLEGELKADYGDYVIRGVKGEFYPCKPDIFEQTYEIVNPPVSPVD